MEPARRRPSRDDVAGPQPVADVLDRWLAVEGLSDLRALGKVRACWEDVVGPDVARHATPRSLRDGALLVAVDHRGWATELRFQEERIVEGLAARVGRSAVGRLDMRVDISPLT